MEEQINKNTEEQIKRNRGMSMAMLILVVGLLMFVGLAIYFFTCLHHNRRIANYEQYILGLRQSLEECEDVKSVLQNEIFEEYNLAIPD